MNPVEVQSGDGPIVLGLPHTGTYVPDDIAHHLNPLGRTLGDTDWHIHRLYDQLLDGVTTVRAVFHRYVIDANRAPSDESLYPGQNSTGLVPTTNFDGEPIWTVEPTQDEVRQRCEMFHSPYHAALELELNRVKARHGVAILYDCHSIRSRIPFLFDGLLPDFNVGTNDGKSCAVDIEQAVASVCEYAKGYSSVTNGRFKGGWTTRNYGNPTNNIHAIQMELAQSTHLESEVPPFEYDERAAAQLRTHLTTILRSLADLAPTLTGQSAITPGRVQ